MMHGPINIGKQKGLHNILLQSANTFHRRSERDVRKSLNINEQSSWVYLRSLGWSTCFKYTFPPNFVMTFLILKSWETLVHFETTHQNAWQYKEH